MTSSICMAMTTTSRGVSARASDAATAPSSGEAAVAASRARRLSMAIS